MAMELVNLSTELLEGLHSRMPLALNTQRCLFPHRCVPRKVTLTDGDGHSDPPEQLLTPCSF